MDWIVRDGFFTTDEGQLIQTEHPLIEAEDTEDYLGGMAGNEAFMVRLQQPPQPLNVTRLLDKIERHAARLPSEERERITAVVAQLRTDPRTGAVKKGLGFIYRISLEVADEMLSYMLLPLVR